MEQHNEYMRQYENAKYLCYRAIEQNQNVILIGDGPCGKTFMRNEIFNSIEDDNLKPVVVVGDDNRMSYIRITESINNGRSFWLELYKDSNNIKLLSKLLENNISFYLITLPLKYDLDYGEINEEFIQHIQGA
jgi:hypothetical protein